MDKKQKKNIKLYKIYRSLNMDVLFYFAIIYLFLTNQKGLDVADTLLFEALFIIAGFLAQIPCSIMTLKIGKRNSLIISNLFNALSTALLIIAPNMSVIGISQFFSGTSFAIRDACEEDILFDSLQGEKDRSKKFTIIEGNARARFNYLDACSSILSGFLYVVNPYVPLVLSLIISCCTLFLSIGFEEVCFVKEKAKEETIGQKYHELIDTLKDIVKSNRLKFLIMLDGILWSLLYIIDMLRNTVLLDIGVQEQYIGLIIAIFTIIRGIASKNAEEVHEKHRNRTFEYLLIPIPILFLGAGLLLKYLNNFTNNSSEKRIKISTARLTIENLFAAVTMVFSTIIMKYIEDRYTIIILAVFFSLVFVIFLTIMRKYVGKKKEEYGKDEII